MNLGTVLERICRLAAALDEPGTMHVWADCYPPGPKDSWNVRLGEDGPGAESPRLDGAARILMGDLQDRVSRRIREHRQDVSILERMLEDVAKETGT